VGAVWSCVLSANCRNSTPPRAPIEPVIRTASDAETSKPSAVALGKKVDPLT